MENFFENLSQEQLIHIIKLFDVQIAIVIVLVVFLTKSFFSKIVLTILNKFLKRKKKPKESGMYGPLKFIYVVLGIYLAVNILPIKVQIIKTANDILGIAITFFITKVITTIVLDKDSKIFQKIMRKTKNETVKVFACRILNVVVWFISIYFVFLQLGIDLSGLFTGLGIGAVIISLAAQDTVKSLLSGLMILSDKPFVIGDWINVGNYAGTVIDITFRSTRIRCVDNSIVTIPNSTITSEYIINWNKLKARRFDCTLNLVMNISPDKIKKIIKELKVVICSKDYVKTDSVYVGFNKIGDFSYDIKIFMYINETNYIKFLKLQEDLNCEFLKVLEKEQVELAYPTETVHIEK